MKPFNTIMKFMAPGSGIYALGRGQYGYIMYKVLLIFSQTLDITFKVNLNDA